MSILTREEFGDLIRGFRPFGDPIHIYAAYDAALARIAELEKELHPEPEPVGPDGHQHIFTPCGFKFMGDELDLCFVKTVCPCGEVRFEPYRSLKTTFTIAKEGE